MSFEQLLAAVERTTFDEKTVADLRASVKQSCEEFDRTAREHAVTEEMLSMTCSL